MQCSPMTEKLNFCLLTLSYLSYGPYSTRKCLIQYAGYYGTYVYNTVSLSHCQTRAATEGTQHVYKYVSLNQSNASCNRTYVYNAVCLNQMSNASCNRTYIYNAVSLNQMSNESCNRTYVYNAVMKCPMACVLQQKVRL